MTFVFMIMVYSGAVVSYQAESFYFPIHFLNIGAFS